jgi:hypothetical protein
VVLLLGLLHGLVYLAVLPPWQHYDEPSHLEYVLLIARRGSLPRSGDYDLAMRQEIASSMQATGFWKGQATPAIGFWSESPPGIGVDELVHPPLYYALLALAELPFVHQSVETQLYVARFCSLGLYLVALAAAYGLVAEAFPRRRWLPVVVATFLALLPPFTDRMTSVNNDVGATAVTSLFLWAAVVLARRGLSPRRAGLVVLLAALCVAIKNTAMIVAVGVVVVLAAAYLPRKLRHRLWAVLGCLCLAAIAGLLAGRGQAAGWYSIDPYGAPNRALSQTPLDSSSFLLSAQGGTSPRGLLQELPGAEGHALRGHTITFGGWLRAAGGMEGQVTFNLDEGSIDHLSTAEATGDWQFHAFTATLGLEARGVVAQVYVPKRPEAAQAVYLDGLMLVDGSLPPGEAPIFQGPGATQAEWGGQAVTNLLRNGSAERSWPGLPSWIGNPELLRRPELWFCYSVWDWGRTHWVYPYELRVLFKSFWGSFGWNHLFLPSATFWASGALTILGLAGAGVALVHRRRWAGRQSAEQRRVWLVLLAAVLVGWGMTILRIHPLFLTMRIYWPVARYADVAIVPTAVLLCAGWAELVPRRLARMAAWAGVVGLLCLDAMALGGVIVPYYFG